MLALFNRTEPAHALTYSEVFALWRKRSEAQMKELTDLDKLRQVLAATLA